MALEGGLYLGALGIRLARALGEGILEGDKILEGDMILDGDEMLDEDCGVYSILSGTYHRSSLLTKHGREAIRTKQNTCFLFAYG